MKRVITSLSLLLLLCGAYAQSISKYEYWTDDDYASRSVVNSSGGDISLDIPTDNLSAGIHLLNFRAGRSDGVWGNLYRYLYYIPTLKNSETGDINMEYWLDDNLAEKKSETVGGGNLSLALDISTLTPGVHYFNCTPISASGERGSSERLLFYIPLPHTDTADLSLNSYEYWLDDDYANKVSVTDNNAQQTFDINISQLTSGIHYFNYRAVNNQGTWGQPIRKVFYLARAGNQATSAKYSYEYWIDNNTANKTAGEGVGPEFTFAIGVSEFSDGDHTFNFRAMDMLEHWSNTFADKFFVNNSLPYVLGDVNCDGKVNVADIVAVINYQNEVPLPYTYDIGRADMDGDNAITNSDFTSLVNLIMGVE